MPRTQPRTQLYFPYILFLLSLFILAVTTPPLSSLLSRATTRLTHLTSQFKPLPAITSRPYNMSSNYSKELRIASLAVQRATLLTRSVYNSHTKGTLSKSDSSPVTIGDFGAQALIISAIKHNFPSDEIVGEEDADDLRSNPSLRDLVWDLVQKAKLEDKAAEEELGGPIKDADAMLEAIDAGRSQGGRSGRIWALDPIDGTKGFLRGGQYAVCLALLIDGEPTVGVIGCPNLPVDDSAPLTSTIGADADDAEGKGVLFAAISGQGASSSPLSSGGLQKEAKISMKPISDITTATFCESVEAGHSSHGDQAAIASQLGISKPSVRMDSQAKYCSIARGAGDLYLRLPVSKTYEEKIWDHAAGVVIVEEAGGKVTDAWGRKLDFGIGRTLKENKGVVAAPSGVHEKVIGVVKSVLSAKE